MEMILLKKQKKLQVPSIIASVMVIMTLLISVGYSAFNTKLNVKDIKAVVRVEKDVRVTNVTAQGNNSGVSNWEDYNVNNISGSVRLPNANSTVTYKVEITNIGNVEVGIFKYITEGLPADLTYETIFSEKSKICDNLSTIKCTMGAKRTIDIVIKYKDGKYNAATTATKDYTFNLGFDFRTYHKITYKNITGYNLPTDILEGDTLNIDIGTGYVAFKITQGGNALTYSQYTYQNGQLTIQNVTGDLVIEGLKPISLYATIQDGAVMDNIKSTNVSSNTGIDFTKPSSTTNGQGKYIFSSTSSNTYPIYYYRGDDTLNNNVLFGNFCWKIVRTTSTGGIKMIYSGKPINGFSCTNTNRNIGTSDWASSRSFGFFGTNGNGNVPHANIIIKKLNEWFSTNLEGRTLTSGGAEIDYSKYLEDAIWYQHNYNAPGNADRVANGKPNIKEEKSISEYGHPSYVSCPISSSGTCLHIEYPVGLISKDEAMLAGISINSNTSYATYVDEDYNLQWLLTDVMNMDILMPKIDFIMNNQFDSTTENLTFEDIYPSVRPSISLKNAVTYVNGDGSAKKPYEIIYGW